MFPYVCLATLPIFCNEDWPKRLLNRSAVQELKVPRTKSDTGRGFKAGLMALYVLVQLTLPWSHSITLVGRLILSLMMMDQDHLPLTLGLQQLDERPLRLLVGYDGPRLGHDARRRYRPTQVHREDRLLGHGSNAQTVPLRSPIEILIASTFIR